MTAPVEFWTRAWVVEACVNLTLYAVAGLRETTKRELDRISELAPEGDPLVDQVRWRPTQFRAAEHVQLRWDAELTDQWCRLIMTGLEPAVAKEAVEGIHHHEPRCP